MINKGWWSQRWVNEVSYMFIACAVPMVLALVIQLFWHFGSRGMAHTLQESALATDLFAVACGVPFIMKAFRGALSKFFATILYCPIMFFVLVGYNLVLWVWLTGDGI